MPCVLVELMIVIIMMIVIVNANLSWRLHEEQWVGFSYNVLVFHVCTFSLFLIQQRHGYLLTITIYNHYTYTRTHVAATVQKFVRWKIYLWDYLLCTSLIIPSVVCVFFKADVSHLLSNIKWKNIFLCCCCWWQVR